VLPMDAAKLLPDGTKSIGGFRGDATSGSSWDFGASGTRSSDDKYTLSADAALLLVAQSSADAMVAADALPSWPGQDVSPVVHVGVIGSSDTWTQHRSTIEKLHREHGTLCEEMECQAIATVCRMCGVPFLGKDELTCYFVDRAIAIVYADPSRVVICVLWLHVLLVSAQQSRISATTSCVTTLLML
jgi:hypothetical protein